MFLGFVGLFGLLTVLASIPYTVAMLQTWERSNDVAPAGADDSAAQWSFAATVILFAAAGLIAVTFARTGPTLWPLRVARRTLREYILALTLGTMIALCGMLLAGIVSGWVVAHFHAQADSQAGEQWARIGAGPRLVASLNAGLLEEISYVLLPLAALGAIRLLASRRNSGSRLMPSWVAGVALGIVIVFCLLERAIIHTYQGPVHAAAAMGWALVNILVFLVLRSILALIAAHVIFDFVVAGTSGAIDYVLPAAIIIGCGVAMVMLLDRMPGRLSVRL